MPQRGREHTSFLEPHVCTIDTHRLWKMHTENLRVWALWVQVYSLSQRGNKFFLD